MAWTISSEDSANVVAILARSFGPGRWCSRSDGRKTPLGYLTPTHESNNLEHIVGLDQNPSPRVATDNLTIPLNRHAVDGQLKAP